MEDTASLETRSPDLIAIMAFDPMTGLVDLEEHLATLRERTAAIGGRFDRHAVRNELQAATFRLRAPATVRLLVSPTGVLAIETTPNGAPNS